MKATKHNEVMTQVSHRQSLSHGSSRQQAESDSATKQDSLKVLRIQKVKDKTGLSRTTIYEEMKFGFPKPIQLTRRSVGWLESAVDQWISTRQEVSHD